ncbi:hypothetical protein RFI_31313, partial [Reticulomyxa filosa]
KKAYLIFVHIHKKEKIVNLSYLFGVLFFNCFKNKYFHFDFKILIKRYVFEQNNFRMVSFLQFSNKNICVKIELMKELIVRQGQDLKTTHENNHGNTDRDIEISGGGSDTELDDDLIQAIALLMITLKSDNVNENDSTLTINNPLPQLTLSGSFDNENEKDK